MNRSSRTVHLSQKIIRILEQFLMLMHELMVQLLWPDLHETTKVLLIALLA